MKTPPPLTDAEINEIDELLAAVPAPYETVDAVILDGYLAGVLVQPVMLEPEQWLPPIFGTEGMPEGGIEGWSEAQHNRLITLITRRKDEMLRGILEDGWFDPLVPMMEDEDGKALEGKDAMEGLGYWAAGFEWALANFPQLEEAALPGVPDLLDSIWRHLPEQDETQRAMTKALDEEHPLRNLDEGIEALVFDVVDLAQIGIAERTKVETVVRDQPKVGRNDPCPCGSGRKYKQCHGAN
ncbi:prepilin peptidase [Aquabacterium olei]|jgi:uncharacterized protein|uniref:Prepilin peptidase n=1 Tax=Aquabacterium olei TaxID=1296669 RepID=A0A2U8FN30_9BURK|nr:UPF0149 family protein [Aquabacterium olei]AWI52425.1 prepilin peptidase [Aquabacterium olei]